MPITDYNKKKKLEVTNTNDSGTTQDKAQPVLISGIDKNYSSTTNDEFNVAVSETNVKLDFEGIISEFSFEAEKDDTATVEVIGSNSNILASKSISTTSNSLATASFSSSDYSRNINKDETVTVKVSAGSGTSLVTVNTNFNGFENISGDYPAQDVLSEFSAIKIDTKEPITGTGNIGVDFTNIAGPEDIAVYDQNGNLLDYEIESLDTAAETGVIWAYDSWVRDDTVQAQVAYGNNSSNTDRQATTETVWGNVSNILSAYDFSQTTEPLLDLTNSNNDENTSFGNVTDRNASGPFNGAYTFDGVDDEIEMSGLNNIGTPHTLIIYLNYDSVTAGDFDTIIGNAAAPTGGANGGVALGKESGNRDGNVLRAFYGGEAGLPAGTDDVILSNTTPAAGETYMLAVTRNASDNINIYVDGVNEGSATAGGSYNSNTADFFIGSSEKFGEFFEGQLDMAAVYQGEKSQEFLRAEFDASPKAGQVYFSQQAAEATVTEIKTYLTDLTPYILNGQRETGII